MIKRHPKLWLILGIVMAVLLVIMIVGTIIATSFSAEINAVFDVQPFKIIEGENTENIDKQYYKSAYATGNLIKNASGREVEEIDVDKLMEYEEELCAEVLEEGATLLINDNEALPLGKEANVTLFSQSSARLIYGGTGSGAVKSDPDINLKSALEKAGANVNQQMWNFYNTGDGAKYKRSIPSLKQESSDFWINEAPLTLNTPQVNSFKSYGDAAIVVIARSGGEDADLPRPDASNTKTDTKDGDYLVLNDVERDMLQYIATRKGTGEGQFKKIIVLLNGSNMVQLDFLNDPAYKIDACMWIGCVGLTGIYGVGNLLVGNVNPSGRTVETYLKDNFSNPVLKNFGKYTWTDGTASGLRNDGNNHSDRYVVYQEGIYLGYRYYETRYEDYVLGEGNAGNFDYYAQVAFPFGAGKSYTDFTYSEFDASENSDGDFEISVKVTNKTEAQGGVAGKHTVMAFFQSPYTAYDKQSNIGIEKASVELCGFEKTTEAIAPGGSDTITITVPKTELRTYDANGKGTYILEDGDYFFTIGSDSHDAVNNILAKKGKTPANTDGKMDAAGNAGLVWTWNPDWLSGSDSIDEDIFSTSHWGEGDVKITNQFDDVDINRYAGRDGQSVKYLSRNNWTGTFPTDTVQLKATQQMKDDGLVLSDELYANARAAYMEAEGLTEDMKMPTLGATPSLNAMMLREEVDFDDDKWDLIMNQAKFSELYNIIVNGFHMTQPVESIGLPGTKTENGPQGLTASLVGGHSSMAFTSADVLAATYNRKIARNVGECFGEDCLTEGYSGMYAPGANIHRTSYQGRNFEYYSEDGFISAHIARAQSLGINSKGVFLHMKHFILNEQETGRFGVATWVNEQAMREIYLEAFEYAIADMEITSVMSSYNRIGVVWAGAHRGLMVNVLYDEWNCGSINITDCMSAGAVFADGRLGIYGGTNMWDGYGGSAVSAFDEKDPVMIYAMKKSVKQIAQTIIRSNGVNGLSSSDKIVAIMPWWNVLLIVLIIVFGILTVGFAALFVIAKLKPKQVK